jgi:ribosomal protein S18 acetylase RimI-like enzyme
LGSYLIRQIEPNDSPWVSEVLRGHWGSTDIFSRGRHHHADQLPGFIATGSAGNVGVVTYFVDGSECEIVTLNSTAEGRGVGSALLKAVESVARQSACTRLRVVTTNDNLKALRFYQKRGFVLVALHRNAVERTRKLKPEIPATGSDGIPIRDELELEFVL